MQKVLLMVLALLAPHAYGAYIGPVVVKTNATGFVMPEWTRVETCELHQDKIVIKRWFGRDHVITEEKPLTIEGSLLALSEQAAKETVREEPGMVCDLPSTRVHAVTILPNDATAEVPLFTTGACGAPEMTREGGASKMLRDMIDLYCPLTYVTPGE